ncbi:MAG: Ca-activated chloride channel [Frankiaceae bacterium]|nr:Ca-activated chloride channel [Frankiaceae bacterium]
MTRRSATAFVLLVVSAVVLLPGPVGAAAPGDPAVMLLVDVSGSMADDDGTGTVKLAGAKNALGAFIADLPEDVAVGLRTYPDGSGDCGDGRLRRKIESLNRSRLGAEVRSLKAEGGTPTAQALKAAARDLQAFRAPAYTIVLVSDGESNCDRDGPVCDVAEKLAGQGLDITVNTVGFQISEAGRTELECIARATGGVYSDIKTSAALADRLNEISKGRLDVTVRAPRSIKVTVGAGDPTGRQIVATVTNPGVKIARGVRATLQFVAPDANAPRQVYVATLRPTRLLGNLGPGQSSQVTWQFRPALDFRESTLAYRVLAGPVGGATTEVTGRIDVSSRITLDDAGPLLRDKRKVVIVGDSYSAGEGAGSYEAGTDSRHNACHRSTLTYAVALFPDPPVNLACSGAGSADVGSTDLDNRSADDKEQLPAQARQLVLLRDGGYVPDLVLMTLGGNDVDFVDIVTKCSLPGDCSDDLWGSPVKVRGHFEDRLRALPASFEYAVSLINSAVNSKKATASRGGKVAPIVILAYPQLFPTAVGRSAKCQGYVSGDEIRLANGILHDLDRTLSLTAESLRRSRPSIPVYFAADVEEAFLPDHTMCGAAPWVNEINFIKTVAVKGAEGADKGGLAVAKAPWGKVTAREFAYAVHLGGKAATYVAEPALSEYRHAYHPNADGYRGMTAALVRYSNSTDANTPVPPDPLSGLTAGPLQGAPIQIQGGDTGALHLEPGTEHALRIDGLPPNAAVEIVIRSAPGVLASTATDAAGTARASIVVPPTLPDGDHMLEVVAFGPEGQTRVRSIRVVVRSARPDWWTASAVGGPLLLLAAAFVERRRRSL